MTKEQIMLFDAKLDKLNSEDLLYFNGFKDAIQFLVNVVFPVAERSAYDMKDDVMRYPYTRILFNMKMALEEKLVDELFRRMDQTIEGYKKEYLMKEDEEEEDDEEDFDDFLIDPGKELPDSSIDFMNIGGDEDD